MRSFNEAELDDEALRRATLEQLLGAHCWLDGGSIVLPGVAIGEGTTVGAGSAVTRDLPAGVLAVGNPCRVLRPLR